MIGSISISDINEALPRALPLLLQYGKRFTADSLANARETIEWPGLFITEYWRPQRNVLFDPIRDANPFFHYLEAMWIIAGRDDVRTLAHILPRVRDFSDDGVTFHGAYGHRLRHWPGGTDQLEAAIGMLRASPNTRQCVLGIWDPTKDLGARTKDMPCNDMLMLKIRDDRLNITVSNRSNDSVWGCYGANAVQFSMLQMYLAASIGVGVGTYCQVSDSFHVYSDNPYWQWFLTQYEKHGGEWAHPLAESRTTYASLDDSNLFEDNIGSVDADLSTFWIEAQQSITNGTEIPMFARSLAVRTAISMWNTLHCHRRGEAEKARTHAWAVEPDGWRTAAMQWLERRAERAKKAS